MKTIYFLILLLFSSLDSYGQQLCNPDSMTYKELLTVNCCVKKTKIDSKNYTLTFPNCWNYKNDEYAMSCLSKFITEKNARFRVTDSKGNLSQLIWVKNGNQIKSVDYYKNGKKKSIYKPGKIKHWNEKGKLIKSKNNT
jgi:hypothetical protein